MVARVVLAFWFMRGLIAFVFSFIYNILVGSTCIMK